MGQLDMNHALVMALATIHLGNVTATLGNAIAVNITMEQLAKVNYIVTYTILLYGM